MYPLDAPQVHPNLSVMFKQNLELPLPDHLNTKILGIHQSDVIIKTAIDAAISDMRANPWLLDYVWTSLPQDALTHKSYGMADLQRSKEWFLNTDIRVAIGPVMDEMQTPCIVITLRESAEVPGEATLGDINPETSYEENTNSEWPALSGPLTPVSYTVSTGRLVLRGIPSDVSVCQGMCLVDKKGTPHTITRVDGINIVYVQPRTAVDFRGCVLKSAKPAWLTDIESVSFRETYQLGIKVGGEPTNAVLLHSVLVFILLRYKEVLLEARGFERSTFSSSDLTIDQEFSSTEFVFSRAIQLSGFVRQYWPKLVSLRLDAALGQMQIESDFSNNDGWIGDQDSVVAIKK